jgi:hypothetical protein
MMKNKLLKLTLGVVLFGTSIYASEMGKTVIPTKHNKNLTIKEIAEIQPGLGTIMIEFGHRFYITYYAAKAQNWGLAAYELHELIEAQEVAETTRPSYKKQLKAFEDKQLKQLEDAIKAKDWSAFEKEYAKTTTACNSCHEINGHSYIKFKLPKEAPKYLDMESK